MFIVDVDEKGQVAWVLYRNDPAGGRAIRIARRANPADMLSLVKSLAK